MLRSLLLIAGLAAVIAAPANAQSIQQTLSNFGLFGTWATDCSRPAAKDNFYTVYKSSGGKVLRTYYDGPGKVYNEYSITEASQISSDQVRYVQEGTDSKRLRVEVILKKADNPKSTGEIVFQPMAPHCWGPPRNELTEKMAAQITKYAPAGADVSGWKY